MILANKHTSVTVQLTTKWGVAYLNPWSEHDCRKFTGAILRIKDRFTVGDGKWLIGH